MEGHGALDYCPHSPTFFSPCSSATVCHSDYSDWDAIPTIPILFPPTDRQMLEEWGMEEMTVGGRQIIGRGSFGDPNPIS
jgi:hypothetical protein